MFSILNEMKDDSPRKTTGVVAASIGSAATIYALVAITGYLSFGDNVSGNIISMYKPSIASTIGKAAIVVLVMFSYALQVHPCRASVDAVLKWRPNPPAPARSDSPSRSHLIPGVPARQRSRSPVRRTGPPVDTMSDVRFALITTAIVILSYVVAMTVSSLERVLAYVGSTGSTSISFILPGLFFYKISAPDSPHEQRRLKTDDDADAEDGMSNSDNDDDDAEGPTYSFDKGPAWRKAQLRKFSLALAIYGLVVMVVCLITNAYFTVAH